MDSTAIIMHLITAAAWITGIAILARLGMYIARKMLDPKPPARQSTEAAGALKEMSDQRP